MKRFHYPLVAATGAIGVLAGVCWLIGWQLAAGVIVAVFALGIAGLETVRMIRRLRHGVIGVDLLAVVAIVSTVLVGELLASWIIVLMLTGGEALEDFAQGRAERELKGLIDRAPRSAHRIASESGTIEEVAVGDVIVGDRLLVKPSEIVPVDGTLSPDTTAVEFDESSLTGESLPVEHHGGDLVLSGSINGSAAVTMTATADARHSQYQSIVLLVTEAASRPAPVVRLADRFALPFTAFALLLGATAWIVSGDPVRFAEVLVLATPCPLIIAAPIAFMAGMSRAAKNGVIVKGGAVLETLSRARSIVFDKTGTLTEGRPTITRFRTENGFTERELLRLAASAEQYSSHVLAESVIRSARDAGLELDDTDDAHEVATAGVEARFAGHDVLVGKLGFVAERASGATEYDLEPGELAISVAVDGVFAGAIIAHDGLRANATSTIADLLRRGARHIIMLTGDAPATAHAIAAQAGITDVRAGCLPADKVEAVARLDDRPVVMVGDGVNDAPVLAAADVGIAMGARGATAASDSADVVILLDDLSKTATAVRIGQDSVRIALQSIWIGIGLSVALMTTAAFGVIPAALGAGLQEAVDLVCILNALRALRDPVTPVRAPR
ncbi:heavy metal translocating P-type ATPase [Herbiconiux ginsengi]|uniref:Heavy metal-(Cd/Co/Hg/Pb/Zn)-translocating P-type ATPase n=1 Tax=Herbiconiux ginsengi TaxID=381665 RepID=A0A1H3SYL4_9MICO|nr:heavy metal translocating P-type ATPase [Herbiconiux ginsengi]SDZ42595.1 heavy metal-(Cd/Co/Hg/Pb/Zn)-translocating P-type ATPase [Herbiconiux ginsengi]